MARKTHQPHLSTLKDARAVRTRQVLRTALLELLEKKPLELIAIRDICKAAHIGYVTFYRHYQTKESLLNDIAAEQVQRLAESSFLIMDTLIRAMLASQFARISTSIARCGPLSVKMVRRER